MTNEDELDVCLDDTASIEDLLLWGDMFLDQPSQRSELVATIKEQWPEINRDSVWALLLISAYSFGGPIRAGAHERSCPSCAGNWASLPPAPRSTAAWSATG